MERKIVPLTSCSLKALAFNPRCKSFHQMYALHIEPSSKLIQYSVCLVGGSFHYSNGNIHVNKLSILVCVPCMGS